MKDLIIKALLTTLSLIAIFVGVFYDDIYRIEYSEFSIELKPLGEVRPEHLTNIQTALAEKLSAKVRIGPPAPLQPKWLTSDGVSYQIEDINQFLEETRSPEVTHVIAITTRPIAARHWTLRSMLVAGAGKRFTQTTTISPHLFALSDLSSPEAHEVLSKLALHEFGHMIGLKHCWRSRQCIMQDAHGDVGTLYHLEDSFCSACSEEISEVRVRSDQEM